MTSASVLPGLSAPDTNRTVSALRALIPYLPPDDWQLVGGLVVRHHLHDRDAEVPVRSFNGLDVAVTGGMDQLRTRSSGPHSRHFEGVFHMVHYHPHEPGATVPYAALIHRDTGVKINIFPARHNEPGVLVELVPGLKVPVQALAQQAVSLLQDLLKLDRDPPEAVDPKQFGDMERLWNAVESDPGMLAAINAAWRNRHPKEMRSFEEAWVRAQILSHRFPRLVKRNRYTSLGRRLQQLFLPCPQCGKSPKFYRVSHWKAAYTVLRRRGVTPSGD